MVHADGQACLVRSDSRLGTLLVHSINLLEVIYLIEEVLLLEVCIPGGHTHFGTRCEFVLVLQVEVLDDSLEVLNFLLFLFKEILEFGILNPGLVSRLFPFLADVLEFVCFTEPVIFLAYSVLVILHTKATIFLLVLELRAIQIYVNVLMELSNWPEFL